MSKNAFSLKLSAYCTHISLYLLIALDVKIASCTHEVTYTQWENINNNALNRNITIKRFIFTQNKLQFIYIDKYCVHAAMKVPHSKQP